MPSYIITDPATGEKYQLDGDRPPPTPEELGQIFGGSNQSSPVSIGGISVGEKPQEPPPRGLLKEAGDAFVASAENTIPLIKYTGALGASLVGKNDTAKRWYESAKQDEEEIAKSYKPTVNDFTDALDSWDKFGHYVAYNVGNVLPSLVEFAASTAVGAAIGGAATPEIGGLGAIPGAVGGLVFKNSAKQLLKKGVERLVEKGVARQVEKELAEVAAGNIAKTALSAESRALLQREALDMGKRWGGNIAGIAVSIPMNVGDVAGNVYDATGGDVEATKYPALIGGSIAAAVDTFVPSYLREKFFPGAREIPREEAHRVGSYLGRFFQSAGKELVKVPPMEAGQEVFQELASIAAEKYATGQPPTLTSDDWVRLRENAVGGAIGGLLGFPLAAGGEGVHLLRERKVEEQQNAGIRARMIQRQREGGTPSRYTIEGGELVPSYDNQNRQADVAAPVTGQDQRQTPEPWNVPESPAGEEAGAAGGVVQKPPALTYSSEMVPGSSAPDLPGLSSAPLETKREYHRDMLEATTDPATGRDIIAEALGMTVTPSGKQFTAPSLYRNPQGRWEFNPATQLALPVSTDKASDDPMVSAYALLHGIYAKQNAVSGMRPLFKTGNVENENGVEFSLGRSLTEDEIRRVKDALVAAIGEEAAGRGVGFFNRPDGFRLVNYGAGDNVNMRQHFVHAIDSLKIGVDSARVFEADGIFYENDWIQNPKGEQFAAELSRLLGESRRSDLQGRLDNLLAPRIRAVHDRWSARLSAQPASGSQPATSARSETGTVAAPAAKPVPPQGAVEPRVVEGKDFGIAPVTPTGAFSYYGYWLSPQGKFYPVGHWGHAEAAVKILSGLGVDIADAADSSVYSEMFKRGWIRGVKSKAEAVHDMVTRAQRMALEDAAFSLSRDITIDPVNRSGDNLEGRPMLIGLSAAKESSKPKVEPITDEDRAHGQEIVDGYEKKYGKLLEELGIVLFPRIAMAGPAQTRATDQKGALLEMNPDLIGRRDRTNPGYGTQILYHEMTHAAFIAVAKNQWEAEGRPGTFIDYYWGKYAEIYEELPASVREYVRKVYFPQIKDATTGKMRETVIGVDIAEENIAAEYMRMLVERLSTGHVEEQIRLGIGSKVVGFLRSLFDYFARVLSGDTNPNHLQYAKWMVKLIKNAEKVSGQKIIAPTKANLALADKVRDRIEQGASATSEPGVVGGVEEAGSGREVQARISSDEELHRRMLLAPSPEAGELEARGAGAQSKTLLDIFRKHNSGNPVPSQVERRLGLKRMAGIEAETARYVSPEVLDDVLARLSGSPKGVQQMVMKDVWGHMLEFRNRVDAITKDAAAQNEYLKTAQFKALRTAEQLAQSQYQASASLEEATRTNLKNAMDKVQKALREESHTDEGIARLEQQLRDLQKLQNRTAASRDMAMDVINVLSMDPSGMGLSLLLNGGTPVEFEKAYRDTLKASPLSSDAAKLAELTGDRATLLKFTGFVLSRAGAQRRELTGLAMLQGNSLIRQNMSAAEKDILESIQRNPSAAFNKYFKQAAKLATAKDKAGAVWLALNSAVRKQINHAFNLNEAARIGKSIIEDPDFRRIEKKIVGELGALVPVPGRNVPATRPNQPSTPDSSIPQDASRQWWFKMDGTPVEINLSPEASEMVVTQARLGDLAGDYAAWLSDPANSELPWHPTVQMEFDIINGLLRSSVVKNPPKWLSQLRNTWAVGSSVGMLRYILQEIGTPLASVSANVASAWEHQSEYMEQWFKHPKMGWRQMELMLYEAAKSHGFTKNRGILGTTAEGVTQWYAEVGRELAAKLQSPTYRPKVGDVMRSGHAITAQDIAAFKTQRDSTTAAYNFSLASLRPVLIGDSKVRDEIAPGINIMRSAIDGGTMTLPRTMSMAGRQAANDIVKLHSDHAALLAYLDEHFDTLVHSYLTDQDADFTPVTGFNEAMKAAGQAIADDNRLRREGKPTTGSPTNMQELVEFVANHTLETEEKAQKAILDGIIGIADNIHKLGPEADEPGNDLLIVNLAMNNSFTQSRGKRLGPDFFYDTGFHTLPSALSFRDGGASFYLDILRKSLESTLEELEATRRRIAGEAEGDSKKAIKAADEQRKKVLTGQSSLDYDRLERNISELRSFIEDMVQSYITKGRAHAHELHKVRRTLSAVISGVVTSGSMALANVAGGTAQQGLILSRLENSMTKAYARAIGLNMMSMLSTIGTMSTVAMREGLKLMTGNGKGFLNAIEEAYNASFGLMQTDRLIREAGLDTPAAIRSRIITDLKMLATGGDIVTEVMPTTALGRVNRAIYMGSLAVTDAALALADPLQPRIFDLSINRAAFWESESMVRSLEKRLRDIYRQSESTGRFNFTDQFDAKNQLTAAEIWPRKYFGIGPSGNANNMAYLEAFFGQQANVPFQESAFRFLKALNDAKPEDRPKVEFLTNKERLAVAAAMAFETNKATRLNRPIMMAADKWFTLMFTLRGWGFNALKKMLTATGRAATDPKTAGWVLSFMAATFAISSLIASGLVGYDAAEMLRRLWARYLRGEERGTKTWWEAQTNAERGQLLATSMFSQLGLWSDFVQWAMVNTPATARVSLVPLGVGKLQDVVGYVGGVVKTGDPTYGLDRLVKGFIPDTAILINKLPGVEGTVDQLNTSRLLKRYLPPELVPDRSFSAGLAGANLTPISPLIEGIVNAIGSGNTAEARKLYEEALAKADELGRDRKLVDQAIASRSPLKRSSKVTPTDEQMAETYGRMSEREQAIVREGLQRWDDGVASLGISSGGGRGGATASMKLPSLPSSGRIRGVRSLSSRKSKQPTSRIRSKIKTGPQPVKVGSAGGKLRMKALKLKGPRRIRLTRANQIG